MKIKRILNHNAIVVKDQNEEKILLGAGIAFNKKKNDIVDPSKIEKTFIRKDTPDYKQFEEILETLPEDHIQISEQIISHAEKRAEHQNQRAHSCRFFRPSFFCN